MQVLSNDVLLFSYIVALYCTACDQDSIELNHYNFRLQTHLAQKVLQLER